MKTGALVAMAASVFIGAVPNPVLLFAQDASLKIVIVEGEDGVNIIDKKTAVKPIVEVRDRNDLPVAGVPVRFAINGPGAAFNNGLRQLTVTTNSLGRATVSQLSPLGKGAFQIQVQATYQGQTAAATINQVNFANLAEAAQAGKTVAQTTQSAAGGGGGGMSGGAIAGIVGGVAAAGVGVALSQKGGDEGNNGGNGGGNNGGTGGGPTPTGNRAPTVTGISKSTDIGLQSATVITFSAQASDQDNDPLMYEWTMGDGTTLMDSPVTHVYTSPGTIAVRAHVSDGKVFTTAETSVIIRNVTGRWVGPVTCPPGSCGMPSGLQFTMIVDATQNGTNVSGTTQQQIQGFPADTCTFSSGRVTEGRVVAFTVLQGCALSRFYLGCVGTLDESLNRFLAVGPNDGSTCDFVRQ